MDRILAAAAASGYGAIEWRGYLGEMYLPRATPFLPENRAATRRRFADAGIGVCCLGSSAVVGKGNVDEVKDYAALAHDLGCPLVRIFGGTPETPAQAVANLTAFGEAAADAGVALALETHDAFSTGATVAALLEQAAHPAVFSLWDLHHPYREGEAIEETYRLLAPTLRHTHVKDSKDGRCTLLGEGDVPIGAMLSLLQKGGYTGVVSVEWEKRWHPEIADPSIAFPQHADALRKLLG